MRFVYGLLFLAALASPSLAKAAAGDDCTVTSSTGSASTDVGPKINCRLLCDSDQDEAAAMTCGPVYFPELAKAYAVEIRPVGPAGSTCAFDTLDIIGLSSATTTTILPSYVTLDDDGTGGSCGSSPCLGYVKNGFMGPWLYATSGASNVGGAGCDKFKIQVLWQTFPQ